MKYLSIIFLSLLISACTSSEVKVKVEEMKTVEKEKTQADFNWIVGDWRSVSEDSLTIMTENWRELENNKYAGFASVVYAGDTIFKENIDFCKVNEVWNFAVKGIEDEFETVFSLSEQTETEFVVENQNNPFPKFIKYWMDGEMLKAKIYGGGEAIDFAYNKL